MNAHTPKPWEAKYANDGCRDIGIVGGGGVIAECFHEIKGSNEGAYGECFANAKLITAAPDLLTALQGLYDLVVQEVADGEHTEQAKAAEAAIAKATGEKA